MRGAMYGLLLVLHILLVVSWLGVDAGVFIGSHMIRNRAYEPGARFLVSRLMAYLDLGPRLSVPLTFAVGLNLAVLGGWATLAVWLIVMTWAAMLAWCAAIVYAFVLQRRAESGHKVSKWLRGYRRLDLWARWAWIALIALALAADISGAQVFRGLWLFRTDVLALLREEGFADSEMLPFDERGRGLIEDARWPERAEWHFPWVVIRAEKAA
jgi:hypothetical protein